jgi:protein arginine kinase activator
MLCQRCHKNLATVRYAEVVNGKVKELYLCPACLSEQQSKGGSGFALAGAAPSPKHERSRKVKPDLVCRSCGTELHEVITTGMLGCAQCYKVFADELDDLIRGLHTSLVHRGKAPRMDDVREQRRAKLHSKRALLRTALKMENYEEAAVLRDNIRALEQELDASSDGAQGTG